MLKTHELLDYSLLVGIHLPGHDEDDNENEKEGGGNSKKTKKKMKRNDEENENNDEPQKKIKKERKSAQMKKEEEGAELESSTTFDRTKWQYHHNGILSPGDDEGKGKGEIYFFGIIDFLCTYNAKKKLAHLWKHNVLFANEVLYFVQHHISILTPPPFSRSPSPTTPNKTRPLSLQFNPHTMVPDSMSSCFHTSWVLGSGRRRRKRKKINREKKKRGRIRGKW